MRQLVVDTETTGLEVQAGHRVIEIGCVEMIGRRITRRHFHQYINPQRDIDDGALEVHGITPAFLKDKPVFKDVWSGFLEFVDGAELIMHNASFDVAFINQEMKLLGAGLGVITDYCTVIDSLELARNKHPGQKNNLDALCKRYSVDNSQRDLHGALLDAEILADVFLLLTGGQVTLSLGEESSAQSPAEEIHTRKRKKRQSLTVIQPSTDELARHEQKLVQLDDVAEDGCVWKRVDNVHLA